MEDRNSTSLKAQNDALNGDDPNEPEGTGTITVPIQVDGGVIKGQVLFVIAQIIAALGGIIAFMGLGEEVWVVKLYRFLLSNQAIPFLGLIVMAVSTLIMTIRTRRKKIERTVLAALAPNRFARVVGPIAPVIQAAIDEAVTQRIDDASIRAASRGSVIEGATVSEAAAERIRAEDRSWNRHKRHSNTPEFEAACDRWADRPTNLIGTPLKDWLLSEGWTWDGKTWNPPAESTATDLSKVTIGYRPGAPLAPPPRQGTATDNPSLRPTR